MALNYGRILLSFEYVTAFATGHALSEDTKPASDIRFPSGSTSDLAIICLRTARYDAHFTYYGTCYAAVRLRN